MGDYQSIIDKYLSRTGMLMCGESVVATMGLALMLIVVLAMIACGSWLVHIQQSNRQEDRQQQIRDVGQLLAQISEQAMAEGQLSSVRRMVMDAALQYELSRCRIVLAEGQVIASRDPSMITADMPAPSAAAARPRAAETVASVQEGHIQLVYPLAVVGHEQISLEITAPLQVTGQSSWELQAGVGLIGIGALVSIWIVYRSFRSRLRAMGVIREALLTSGSDEQTPDALSVDDTLGNEATAWNQMVSEQQTLRKQAVVEKARETLSGASSGSSDLAGGCDAMSHGLALLNEQSCFQYVNHAAAVFLQTPRDKLLGELAAGLISEQRVLDALQDAVSGSTRRKTIVEIDHSDSEAGSVLRYSIHPLHHGNSLLTMLVIEDITQQRVAEEARHQFVAQATHELRTPLTNIRMYIETVIDDGENDAALRSKCMNVINQETGRLERMVSDLLSVAEIEAGSIKINYDDVAIDQILSALEADYERQAQQKKITLAFNMSPKLPVFQGDREKLATAVHNLVANAIKYTTEGGRVTIGVEADEKNLIIEVADTGVGISPDDVEHVFEKFYRADDRRIKELTGSGLGLALAREIIRLHGGELTVQSQLDQGSTFTIVLPLDTAHQATTAA